MTKQEDNKLRMYQAVAGFLDDKLSVISEITEMPVTLEVLKRLIQQINQKFSVSKTVLNGKTQDKYDSESKVIEYTMAVAGGLFAYGSKTNNNELKVAGSITRSYLERLREVELVPIVVSILEKARSISSDLTPFGISIEILTSLNNFVQEHNTSLSKRESASGIKVGATGSLKDLMIKTDDTLEILDKLSEIIKLTNSDFYLEYNSVRSIKNIGEGRSKTKLPETVPVEAPEGNANNS